MAQYNLTFQINRSFIVVFYSALVLWTLLSGILLAGKYYALSASWLGMIIFVIFMTWNWSLSLVLCIEVEGSGKLQLKSLRKNSTLTCSDFIQIDGPPLSIGFGFMRFRTNQGNFYTYFSRPEKIKKILDTIRISNPEIRFHRIPMDFSF